MCPVFLDRYITTAVAGIQQWFTTAEYYHGLSHLHQMFCNIPTQCRLAKLSSVNCHG
ncbi:hypothetical protein Xish_02265 [Xenorhabdus ishibashii]|uniref:Uncharacterized protein n=1 Tax=Xenorhabdus ishibashii TaxID=1034471 RepID=A0A2D0KHY4_9GAMM|nr:hypothetical protein Xish_02265 [Xenorhabdus ishibashii]